MMQPTLQAVKISTYQAKVLVHVCLAIVVMIAPAELDAAGEQAADVQGGDHDAGTLVGDVVLHAQHIQQQADGLGGDGRDGELTSASTACEKSRSQLPR